MYFKLENVELNYNGKNILYGIHLKTETGKVTGILGKNGSGKTSLLRIMFGSLRANNQLIITPHKRFLKNFYASNMVKLLSQDYHLQPNIELQKLFKIYKVDWTKFVKNFPSMKSCASSKPSQLSGGENRLISTWLIIKMPSKLVLLDEPFTHLAPMYIEKIKKEINQEKQQKAFIITDHLYREILELSDDIYLLKDGCTELLKDNFKLKESGYLI